MTGIDFDGSDRFTYPLQVLPEMSLPMTLEVAVSEVEMLSGTLVFEGDFEGGVLELPIEQGLVPSCLRSLNLISDMTQHQDRGDYRHEYVRPHELQNILLRSFGVDFSVSLNGEAAIENPLYADPVETARMASHPNIVLISR